MRGNLDAVANGEVMQQADDDNSVEAQASENNSESDESEPVAGAFETVTTPISADPAPDVAVEDLDDADIVTWIDEIDLGHQGSAESRVMTTVFHRWKGVNWNTLAIIRPGEKTIGLFLGFDNFPELPLEWHVNISFRYSFVSDDGKDVIIGPDVTHHFAANRHEARIDRGNFNTVEIPKLIAMKSNWKEFPRVRIKVTIDEQFSPAKCPINYDSKATTDMVGLENLGATCYLNALLQMLFHVNSFRKAVYMLPHKEEVFKSSTTLALQSVFSNLQTSRKEVTTRDLTVAFGWTTAESFMQQDVQEMMRVLMDKLETKMTNTVVDGFIKKMFAGTVRSFIQCLNVDYVSQREEVFYDIQLDVKGCKNIFDSLDKYIEPEILNGDNQYSAEGHGKQDAKKGVIFTNFPPVLTIHLKRFDFDFNTMGFTKIHDYYEFPERMNLDAYLADNCPPESRAVPNDYVLHSVLVHAGDVGGGHYYAYIRPTTSTYDYSRAGEAGESRKTRDNQWYKFNDDIVMRVQAREAIENTYGRRPSDNLYKTGFASAYMLVYIRVAEAPQIMEPVKPTDVPADLAVRLETELKERRDQERAELRDKMFTQVYFATEDDVRKFVRYGRNSDFLTVNDMTSMKVLKNCKRYGLLLQIAAEKDISPAQIRLWNISNANGVDKLKGPLRVTEDFDITDLKEDCDEDYVYVQILKPEEMHQNAKQVAKFNEEYAKILKEEKSAMNQLRVLILSVPTLAELFSEEDEPTEGCGLGRNSFHVFKGRLIPEEIKSKVAELRQFMQHLAGQFIDEYSQVIQEVRSEGVLVFLRAFDPTNSLPLLLDAPCRTPEGESADANDVQISEDAAMAAMMALNQGGGGGDDALGSLVNRQLYIGADSRQSSPGRASSLQEYMPMKYVGCVMMRKQATVQELLKEFKGMLVSRLGDHLPHDWVDSPSQRLHFEYNSMRNLVVDLHEDSHQTLHLLSKDSQSAIFVVDIPKLLDEPSATNLLPLGIRDPAEWLKYRSHRRMFFFKPYGTRERVIVNKLRNEALLGSTAGSMMDTEDTASEEDGGGGSKKRGVGSEQGSTVSMNEGGAAGAAVGAAESPFSLGDVSEFNQYLPSYDKMGKMFDLMQETLLVDRNHLALYMVPSNFVADNNSQYGNDAMAVTMTEHEVKIDEVMRRMNTLKSTAYHVFYHISPFPLVTEEGKSTLDTHKMHEVFITDARLRKWRQHYLEQLESSSATASLSNSLSASGALKLNNVGTAPTGNSQEDAEGSPPITNNADLKRRRLSPQPSDLLENSNHEQGLSASVLARAQWPANAPNKYDVHELSRVFLTIPHQLTVSALCGVLRNQIGIPTNIDELLSPTEYMNARDIEALDSSYQVLNDPSKVALFTHPAAVVSDALRVAPGAHNTQLSGGNLLPSFPLAVLVIRDRVINEIYSPNVGMQGSVNSWMDCNELISRLYYVGVMYVSPLDMVFMSNKHPTIRSMPVTVFNFTLLGSVVQPCDVDLFGGPFMTYVREDDDYDSFFARVRAISGDSEEEWEKVRTAVVKQRIPYFIRRPLIAQVSNRLGNTKLTSSDSLDNMGAAAANEGKDEESKTGAAAGGGVENNKSIYDHFLAHYREFQHKTTQECRGRLPSDSWVYPTFGIQRSVADAGRKYTVKKAIKIA